MNAKKKAQEHLRHDRTAACAVCYLERLPDDPVKLCLEVLSSIAGSIEDLPCSVAVIPLIPAARSFESGIAPPICWKAGTLKSAPDMIAASEAVSGWRSITVTSPDAQVDIVRTLIRLELADKTTIEGEPSDASMSMYLNSAVLRRAGLDVAARLFERYWELMDATELCYQGLVDVASLKELDAGHYFSTLAGPPSTWSRYIEHWEWLLDSEARKSFVRGNYWGTYLGPGMARKVDKDGMFIERYLTQVRDGIHLPQTARRFAKGGIYVTLSDNPLDMVHEIVHPNPTTVDNMIWLRSAFSDAGILWRGVSPKRIQQTWYSPSTPGGRFYKGSSRSVEDTMGPEVARDQTRGPAMSEAAPFALGDHEFLRPGETGSTSRSAARRKKRIIGAPPPSLFDGIAREATKESPAAAALLTGEFCGHGEPTMTVFDLVIDGRERLEVGTIVGDGDGDGGEVSVVAARSPEGRCVVLFRREWADLSATLEGVRAKPLNKSELARISWAQGLARVAIGFEYPCDATSRDCVTWLAIDALPEGKRKPVCLISAELA